MTSLIKNQILKHLSKFAKNLSPDKINISTMRGRGEMTCLELDEQVITGLLELPAWMRITRVWCSRVSVCIHWTKLKSEPIRVDLDEVRVDIETCEELRSGTSSSSCVSAGRIGGSSGAYGYSDKVIDGMTVTVNSCVVQFNSTVFTANVEFTRMSVLSVSADWTPVSHLRQSRVYNGRRSALLLFKELRWQAMRVEARSRFDQSLSPLRLINNDARCRIIIKKRTSDCSVMGCRLAVLMTNLLWVLTDGQLNAAIVFIDSLTGLIKKATDLAHKVKAVRKLESLCSDNPPAAASASSSYSSAHYQQTAPVNSGSLARQDKLFNDRDVIETSYHVCCQDVHLHFSDDPGECRSSAPELSDGGSVLLKVHQLQLDYYPYHLAFGDRRHWSHYSSSVPYVWLTDTLAAFRRRVLAVLLNSAPQHAPLSRAPPLLAAAANQCGGGGAVPPSERDKMAALLERLMCSVLCVRLADFTMYQVATSHRKNALLSMVCGDHDKMKLPDGAACIHAEMAYFFYPGDVDFPLPPPQVMLHVNPVRAVVDPLTLVWLNAFVCSVARCAANMNHSAGCGADAARLMSDAGCVDVRVEAIMLSVQLCAVDETPPLQRDRPSSLSLNVTRLLLTNQRSENPLEPSSLASLAACLDRLQSGSLAFGSQFPSRDCDLQVVPDRLVLHTQGRDYAHAAAGECWASGTRPSGAALRTLLWHEPRDVLLLHLDPVWLDFGGTAAVRRRAVPLVDAMPVSCWLVHNRQKTAAVGGGVAADLAVVVQAPSNTGGGGSCVQPSPVSVQLNHFQYLFLLRQLERLAEMSVRVALDSQRVLGADTAAASVCVSGALPRLDVSLLMPCPLASAGGGGGTMSSGGDLSLLLTAGEDDDSASSVRCRSCGVAQPNSAVDGDITPRPNTPVDGDASATAGRFSRDGHAAFMSSTPVAAHSPVAAATEVGGSPCKASRRPAGSPASSRSSTPGGRRSVSPAAAVLTSALGVCRRIVHAPPQRSQLDCAGTNGNDSRSAPRSMPPPPPPSLGTSTVDQRSSRQVSGQLGAKLARGITTLVSPAHVASTGSAAVTLSGACQTSTTTVPTAAAAVSASSSGDFNNLDAVSEMSSDSDSFILGACDFETTGSIDPMLHVKEWAPAENIEVAHEAVEDAHSEGSVCSALRRRDLVSVCTLRLGGGEFAYQSCGFKSSVKFCCRHLIIEECRTIHWDEFQAKFQQRSKCWPGWEFPASACSIGVRLDSQFTPVPNQRNHKLDVRAQSQVDLEVKVADLSVDLAMSTVTNLVDFIEDETIKPPLPLNAVLERVRVSVTDDRVTANITSPGSVPIQLFLPAVRVSGDKHGVFTVLSPQPLQQQQTTGGSSGSVRSRKQHHHHHHHHSSPQRPASTTSSPPPSVTTPLTAGDNVTMCELMRRLRRTSCSLDDRLELSQLIERQFNSVSVRCGELEATVSQMVGEKQELMDKLRYLQQQFLKLDQHHHQNQHNNHDSGDSGGLRE